MWKYIWPTQTTINKNISELSEKRKKNLSNLYFRVASLGNDKLEVSEYFIKGKPILSKKELLKKISENAFINMMEPQYALTLNHKIEYASDDITAFSIYI